MKIHIKNLSSNEQIVFKFDWIGFLWWLIVWGVGVYYFGWSVLLLHFATNIKISFK